MSTFGLGPFTTHPANPVLTPVPDSQFERECVYNPAAVNLDGAVHLIYRAEDKYGLYASRLGLAQSRDGVHFTRYPHNPVMEPDGPFARLEARGCEDPRVVRGGGHFYMTYTAYDGEQINLSAAVSRDLVRWEKRGPFVRGQKAGAVLAEPVGGVYWMYFGDTHIWVATSPDLEGWSVRPEPVLSPRPGHFDSVLLEPGPPPLLLEDGIL